MVMIRYIFLGSDLIIICFIFFIPPMMMGGLMMEKALFAGLTGAEKTSAHKVGEDK